MTVSLPASCRTRLRTHPDGGFGPSAPIEIPPSDVYARALAWLQAKGVPQAAAEATLTLFPPSEEGVGETEVVLHSTAWRGASR